MRNTSTSPVSPLSPAPWPNRPSGFDFPWSVLALFGTIAAYLVPAMVILVVPAICEIFGLFGVTGYIKSLRHMSVEMQLALGIISDGGLVLFLLPMLPRLARGTLVDLGMRMPTQRDLRLAVIGAAAMWLVVEPTAIFMTSLTHVPPNEAAIALLRGVNGPFEILEFVLVGVVIAPLAEELAFRALLFRAIERYTGFWPAAVLSGACFGVVHISAPHVADVLGLGVPLAAGGIVLAYLYARSRCLWTNVLAHGIFNSVSVIAVFVFHQKP